jgi:hypothetical protein
MKRALIVGIVLLLFTATFEQFAYAKPKKKVFNNPAPEVFAAALKTARERHVVTYVDEKNLMLTFESGVSFWAEGFKASAAVEPDGPDKAVVSINVQHKKGGWSFNAGDRLANKFFEQMSQALADQSKQKVAAKPAAPAVAVPENSPVAQIASASASTATVGNVEHAKVEIISLPDGADVFLNDAFVGNTPSLFKLPEGKHRIRVTKGGFKRWEKEITVLGGSELKLVATLEKDTTDSRQVNIP